MADGEKAVEQVRPYAPHHPSPKQQLFLKLDAEECFYGGAAGGGKSDSLIEAALAYVDVPGYSAAIFRRTELDLNKPGAILDRARSWFAGTAARWEARINGFRFPSGATIHFGYATSKQEIEDRYQGSEFQFCVAGGTPVLMADGAWKPIEHVRVGDVVATLEGPRAVQRTFSLGTKPVVRVTGPAGSSVVSATHRLLCTNGDWASPMELQPSRSDEFHSIGESSLSSGRSGAQPHESKSSGLQRVLGSSIRVLEETQRLGFAASEAGARSDSSASCDSLRDAELPAKWFAQLELFEPALRSGRSGIAAESLPRAHAHVPTWKASTPSCLANSQRDPCCGDAPPRFARAGGPTCTPSPADAGEPCLACPRADDLGNTQSRSRTGSPAPTHPYRSRALQCVEEHQSHVCEMVQAGEAEVFDLRVEGASHYVTWGGFISSNCGIDEVGQWTEDAYTYLFSRLRRLAGSVVPLRMRAAGNPGGRGGEWVRRRFVENAVHGPTGMTVRDYVNRRKKGQPIPELPIFVSPPSSQALMMAKAYGREAQGAHFVPAFAADNPGLDVPEYMAQLARLDPATRAQLEHGDWWAAAGGRFFQEAWFHFADKPPPNLRSIRAWDLAGTRPEKGKEPDWTAGVRAGVEKLEDGSKRLWITHVGRLQETAAGVEAFVKATAETDTRKVAIFMEEEPGSAGKANTHNYASRVLFGWTFTGVRKTGSKEDYWRPLSADAQNGLITLVRAPWNEEFVRELCGLTNDDSHAHDDMADAAALARSMLVENVEGQRTKALARD